MDTDQQHISTSLRREKLHCTIPSSINEFQFGHIETFKDNKLMVSIFYGDFCSGFMGFVPSVTSMYLGFPVLSAYYYKKNLGRSTCDWFGLVLGHGYCHIFAMPLPVETASV